MTTTNSPIIGVYGGVGPLASVRFLETIYKLQTNTANVEQECSRIILYSDTAMPDRTLYLKLGLKSYLLDQLTQGLDKLVMMGAEKLIICCFTLHYLLPFLRNDLLERIMPLTCIALRSVAEFKKKTLLLCTSGSIHLKIFEQSPFWSQAEPFIIKPDAEDQQLIHQTIFTLKKNRGQPEAYAFIKMLLNKYAINHWVVGCTEFHLLSTDSMFSLSPLHTDVVIDPLTSIARSLSNDIFSVSKTEYELLGVDKV